MTDPLPRISFDSERNPPYVWGQVHLGERLACWMKLLWSGETVIVKFIRTDPDLQGRGFARMAVEQLKGAAKEIVAEDVKRKARGFWAKMGFIDEEDYSRVFKWTADAERPSLYRWER